MRRLLSGLRMAGLVWLLAACGSSTSYGPITGSSGSSHHSYHHRYSRSSSYYHRQHGSSSSYSSRPTSSSSGYANGSAAGPPPPAPTKLLAPRSKTAGCQVRGALPDPACTPGAIFAGIGKARICVLGYSRSVRNVSYNTKRRAYLEYGITYHTRGQYEVDHLVSLELGGSNSIANLWPEAAEPRPGFHEKDQVENYLHDQVCSGRMSLSQAQHKIATNWVSVYRHMTP